MNKNYNAFISYKGNELFIDMILAESIRPILFVCKDTRDHRYLCSCHCANEEKCEWLVAPVDRETIVKLLTDQITIRDAFTLNNTQILVVTKKKYEPPYIQELPIEKVNEILPTAGYYMEAEEGEFVEEIAQLQNEEKVAEEFIQVHRVKKYPTRYYTKRVAIQVPKLSAFDTDYRRTVRSALVR